MQVTVLHGSTFCVSDERGDVDGNAEGLYAFDMRFLSRCVLTVDGTRPLLLSKGRTNYFSSSWFLRNPPRPGAADSAVSIRRDRFVGSSMREQIEVENHSRRDVEFEVALELEADFAAIFEVKKKVFEPGSDGTPQGVAPSVERDGAGLRLVFEDRDSRFGARTAVLLSQAGAVDGSCVRYRVALPPRATWSLGVDIAPSLGDGDGRDARPAEQRATAEESLANWETRVPRLDADWDDLEHSYEQSVADLAALRMEGDYGDVPAAGMPWFMTVFGRDTLITCLQSLVLGPELARSALRVLSTLQATELDPSIDAEPGKIVHELRRGRSSVAWFGRYYGTADATPLYLILLSEYWRWTRDDALVGELEPTARAALEWIDRYGDRDGDGFVEYARRTPRGLLNQSWKDSGDSMVFADGRLAVPPIAPVEVQGYVYDAKLRMAEVARAVWRDEDAAARLEREAGDLARRFDDAFWCGTHYALALDYEKRPVDSVTSNMGHLLWSGILSRERADSVAALLASDAMWSGWGIRTLASDEVAYNPIAYHNGTVWPHDSSLIALGLARTGRQSDAERIVRAMVDASARFAYTLPEVFAGFPREETTFPVEYPTASRPQAWAAGSSILLLQVLLGLAPDGRERVLRTRSSPAPPWVGRLRLSGVRAFDRSWDVVVDGDGTVRAEPT